MNNYLIDKLFYDHCIEFYSDHRLTIYRSHMTSTCYNTYITQQFESAVVISKL